MAIQLNTKRTIILALSIIFIIVLIFALQKEVQRQMPNYKPAPVISSETEHCIGCHNEKGNGKTIVAQWKHSKHAQVGVGCVECHGAKKGDIDAFEHEGQLIATIVSPKDCSKCHQKEYDEFEKSHHADAGMIMGSLDNVLAEVVEGNVHFNNESNPAAVNGCWQCHGSKVEFLKDENGEILLTDAGVKKLDPKTWPNTGIGRINFDGSKGSCSACHNRHSFSLKQVRQPENCGKCHLGPDHPQYEIYVESKHGINFFAHKEDMNLEAQPWIVGKDYSAAPTCATCHISATPDMPVTHDVGDRISWTLRPKVSEKIDEAQKRAFEKAGQQLPEGFLSWKQRRKNMKNVCSQCHTQRFINGFYTQYDNEVNMYNEKFGKPAMKLVGMLKSAKLLTPANFDEKIEWDYFLLWHHEGRRARMGASMMGPDYTQWHGNFEVAERFYSDLIPEIRELLAKNKNNPKVAAIQKYLSEVLNSEMHRWYIGKLTAEEIQQRKAAAKQFRKRYSESD